MTVPQADAAGDGFVVRAEERLWVGSEWVAFQQVAVRRQIVTETMTFTVDVRREVLVFEQLPIEALPIQGTPLPYVPPLSITLSEEVPLVTMALRPYEAVTIRVVQVVSDQRLDVDLAHEEVELQIRDANGTSRA